MNNYIFAGRFQPFHNGHFQILESLVEHAKEGDNIIVAIVSQTQDNSKIIDSEFTNKAKEHHSPERNPWSAVTRLVALQKLVSSFVNEQINISVTIIPRPDLGWETIINWFPCNRIWVIPDAGEKFDENKSVFFKSKGEEVLRLKENTNISGWELRESIKNNDVTIFRKSTPSMVQEIYIQNYGIDR